MKISYKNQKDFSKKSFHVKSLRLQQVTWILKTTKDGDPQTLCNLFQCLINLIGCCFFLFVFFFTIYPGGTPPPSIYVPCLLLSSQWRICLCFLSNLLVSTGRLMLGTTMTTPEAVYSPSWTSLTPSASPYRASAPAPECLGDPLLSLPIYRHFSYTVCVCEKWTQCSRLSLKLLSKDL